MEAVFVSNLIKSYNDLEAVKDLTLSVNPGEILGLIGPNGAGKSTTIKIILDFMQPDSGEVHTTAADIAVEQITKADRRSKPNHTNQILSSQNAEYQRIQDKN